MESCIPVIDFSAYALDKAQVAEEDLRDLAKEVYEAFSNVGFMYLKNHGIPPAVIKSAEEVSDQFFSLKEAQKQKYQRKDTNHGWVCAGKESLNPDRPGDNKEAFNVVPADAENTAAWPNEEVPGFQEKLIHFHHQCDALTMRLLEVIAIGLALPRTFFKECHNTYVKPNPTTLRLLHYPAIQNISELKPGQVRCGEHSDYGTITLLFQDMVGGLEVFSKDGHYVPATPIEGTIVVNIADFMQRWTADKLVSTKHRVLIPEGELKRKTVRRSMAYFVHPDDAHMITCIDGSNKYPPISSIDYLNMRFAATYMEKINR